MGGGFLKHKKSVFADKPGVGFLQIRVVILIVNLYVKIGRIQQPQNGLGKNGLADSRLPEQKRKSVTGDFKIIDVNDGVAVFGYMNVKFEIHQE